MRVFENFKSVFFSLFVCSSFFVVLFTSVPVFSADEFSVPLLTGPVVDKAQIISDGVEQKLNSALNALWQTREGQLAVLTLPNLGGLVVEEASIRVVDKWQLGTKDKDNGVLLLIAKEERKVRIEVGQGLEGELSDAYAKRIIDETVTPLFKAGRFDDGVLLGVKEILLKTNPNFSLDAYFDGYAMPKKLVSHNVGNRDEFFFFVFFVVLFIVGSIFTGGRGYSSGGYSGGSSSGSSFSGGGGGFSGGGASGSW